jgi:hypothetical protein
VPTSIRHLLEKLKSFLVDDAVFYSLLLVLVAVASFGLGRLSVFQKSPENQSSGAISALPIAAANPTPVATVPTTSEQTGEVVASKSGTKYHLPTCSGAKRIKPENLISFASPAAAEAAGYTPAANCPGL